MDFPAFLSQLAGSGGLDKMLAGLFGGGNDPLSPVQVTPQASTDHGVMKIVNGLFSGQGDDKEDDGAQFAASSAPPMAQPPASQPFVERALAQMAAKRLRRPY